MKYALLCLTLLMGSGGLFAQKAPPPPPPPKRHAPPPPPPPAAYKPRSDAENRLEKQLKDSRARLAGLERDLSSARRRRESPKIIRQIERRIENERASIRRCELELQNSRRDNSRKNTLDDLGKSKTFD